MANGCNIRKVSSDSHRCRSRQIFGGAKDFCPNFPDIAEKFLGHLLCDFHAILGPISFNQSTLGTIFIKSKQVGRHFCSYFYGVCPDIQGFSKVFTIFVQIYTDFAGFSPNQNIWACVCTPCTPASYTTADSYEFDSSTAHQNGESGNS